MVWGALGLDKSDVTFSIGVALAMFLFTRRAFAREPFGHAQLGRLILATIGILIGFVLLGLALDAIFGTARLPAVLPRIILNAVAQLLGFLAARFIFPPRLSDEPRHARIHVRWRREL